MLGCSIADGHPRMVSYNLNDSKATDLGPLEHHPGGEASRWFPKFIDVSEDGTAAGVSGLDLDPGHAREHGDGGRVHLIDLETRTLEPVGPTFVTSSDRRFLRMHERPRWQRHAPASALDPTSLRLPAPNPIRIDTNVDRTAVWQEANDVAVKSMKAINNQTAISINDETANFQQGLPNVAAIGVFVPSALRCLRSDAPDVFEEVVNFCAKSFVFAVGNPSSSGPGWDRALFDEIMAIKGSTDGTPSPLAPVEGRSLPDTPQAAAVAAPTDSAIYPKPDTATYPKPATLRDKQAVWSLILGIIGLPLCPFLASPIAIVLGYQSKKRIRESGGQLEGSGMATAGVVLGWLGIAYMVLILVAGLA